MRDPDLLGGSPGVSSGRATISRIAQRAGDMVRAGGEHLHNPEDLGKLVGGCAMFLGGVTACLNGYRKVADGYSGTVPEGLNRTISYAEQVSGIVEDLVPPLVGAVKLFRQLSSSGHNQ